MMKLFSAVCFLHVILSSWFRCLHCCFTVVSQLGRRGRVVGSPGQKLVQFEGHGAETFGKPCCAHDGGVLLQSYFSELVFDGWRRSQLLESSAVHDVNNSVSYGSIVLLWLRLCWLLSSSTVEFGQCWWYFVVYSFIPALTEFLGFNWTTCELCSSFCCVLQLDFPKMCLDFHQNWRLWPDFDRFTRQHIFILTQNCLLVFGKA